MPSSVVLETNLVRSDARPPRQGPRRLRSRRAPAHRRHRSHLGLRLRARVGHSRQGQGADAAVGVLVRARSATSMPHHLLSVDVDDFPAVARAAPRRAARPLDARAEDRAAAGRVRGARVPVGSAGRTTSRPARSAAFRCRPACASPTGCPQPIFTPATKAESGHDENISEAAGRRHRRRTISIARLRDLTLAIYQRGVAHAETCGIIIADTKFEFGLRRRRHELVLIDEVLTPDSSRFWPKDRLPARPAPAELRQAVRARLPRADRLEQAAAGARRCPTTSSTRTREKYLEAYRRLTGRELVALGKTTDCILHDA